MTVTMLTGVPDERVGEPTRPGSTAPDQRASIGTQLRFSGPT
ncbi:hypothetical protein Alvin_0095 [Allochromatium vinosum DSM 180]|uniref:Uncharacterized protein n=1 Tax=Allochromatium vinosum (strain ATCC 17899 / DSM 180 / NBRC 103801 / NCIMB 10441 / D) TaxID=572477 RepID=D3RVD8_ALLVD|nr:hypothetical protein Alvin_0095 [Allochromatium vinosum DSM 180]